jgi:hypothetical protein
MLSFCNGNKKSSNYNLIHPDVIFLRKLYTNRIEIIDNCTNTILKRITPSNDIKINQIINKKKPITILHFITNTKLHLFCVFVKMAKENDFINEEDYMNSVKEPLDTDFIRICIKEKIEVNNELELTYSIYLQLSFNRNVIKELWNRKKYLSDYEFFQRLFAYKSHFS